MHIDIVGLWFGKISKEDDSISDKGASKFYYVIYIIWS